MKSAPSLAIRIAALITLAMMASGCGQRGPLVLPGQTASGAAGAASTPEPGIKR